MKRYAELAGNRESWRIKSRQDNIFGDMFVDWCMVTTFGLAKAWEITGQKMKGWGAGCTASANYYKAIKSFYKANPQPGDQIFFSNDGGKNMNHTGLVTKVTKDRIYTIEGNTSSAAGVVPNGGAVRDKSYSINYAKIAGFGRPLYNLVEEPKAPQNQEKGDEQEMLTQEQFNEMMDKYLRKLAEQPATWDQAAIDWASNKGLLSGDPEFGMMPKKFLTRGELATILQRYDQGK